MRIFAIQNGAVAESDALPPQLQPIGFVWIAAERSEFEARLAEVQAALARLAGGQLVEQHVRDLLDRQLPSHYDYTSQYDVLVFRRLAAFGTVGCPAAVTSLSPRRPTRRRAPVPRRRRARRRSTPARSASRCSTACCCRCIRVTARCAMPTQRGC